MKKVRLLTCGLVGVFFISSLAAPIAAQEQKNISVSAQVPPKASDFQFAFSYEGSSLVPQDTNITYTIIYGAYASAAWTTKTTIVIHYSTDKGPDNSYLVDYVLGSASTAYGDTKPVIDSEKRTITWTIPALPAGVTDQKLTFQLHTTGNFHEAKRLTFNSRVSMQNQYIQVAESGVHQDYLYVQPPSPSPTPTVTPSGLQPTSTSEENQSLPKILSVSPTRIASSEATITAFTSQPTTIALAYGTSPQNLSQRVTTAQNALQSNITLHNLSPATRYYFRLYATFASQKTDTSDIFTFVTSNQAPSPTLAQNFFTITSSGVTLLSSNHQAGSQKYPLLIIPLGEQFEPRLQLEPTTPLKSVTMVIRTQVLGASTLSQPEVTFPIIIPLKQIEPHVYTAHITLPHTLSSYEALVRIIDIHGNVVEEKIGNIKSVNKLRIVDDKTGKPISDARADITIYDLQTKQFVPIQIVFPSIKNPQYTAQTGEFGQILPQGKYQMTINALSYDQKTLTVSIEDQYPTISLHYNPTNILSLVRYLENNTVDSTVTIYEFLQLYINKIRFFHLIGAGSVFFSLILGFLLLSIRTQIKLTDLIPFFLFHLAVLRKKHKEQYLSGIVTSTENISVGRAIIEVIDPQNMTVLASTQSNQAGTFHIRNIFVQPMVILSITHQGFAPRELEVETTLREVIHITLKRQLHQPSSALQELEHAAGSFFEISLLLSLLFELSFFAVFGFARTLPFFIISAFNVLLWLFYLKEHHRNY